MASAEASTSAAGTSDGTATPLTCATAQITEASATAIFDGATIALPAIRISKSSSTGLIKFSSSCFLPAWRKRRASSG